MPLELAAVAFDGAFTAERELNNLRVSRLDPWVGEVAVLEHYHGSMHATRATSPDYGGTGYAGLPAHLGAYAHRREPGRRRVRVRRRAPRRSGYPARTVR